MGISDVRYATGKMEVITMKEGLKGMEKDKEEAKKLKAQNVGWLTRSST